MNTQAILFVALIVLLAAAMLWTDFATGPAEADGARFAVPQTTPLSLLGAPER